MSNRGSWYAVYTRCHQEKQVEAYLRKMGVNTYLPLRRRWSTRKDRKLEVQVPAMPGYLFVNCTLFAETRAAIKRASGVITMVENAGRPAQIPEPQIQSLRTVLESTFNAEGHPYLKTGQKVRVVRGAMAGAEGYLLRVDSRRQRLVIVVDYVNQALSVELDDHCVEPIE